MSSFSKRLFLIIAGLWLSQTARANYLLIDDQVQTPKLTAIRLNGSCLAWEYFPNILEVSVLGQSVAAGVTYQQMSAESTATQADIDELRRLVANQVSTSGIRDCVDQHVTPEALGLSEGAIEVVPGTLQVSTNNEDGRIVVPDWEGGGHRDAFLPIRFDYVSNSSTGGGWPKALPNIHVHVTGITSNVDSTATIKSKFSADWATKILPLCSTKHSDDHVVPIGDWNHSEVTCADSLVTTFRGGELKDYVTFEHSPGSTATSDGKDKYTILTDDKGARISMRTEDYLDLRLLLEAAMAHFDETLDAAGHLVFTEKDGASGKSNLNVDGKFEYKTSIVGKADFEIQLDTRGAK